MEIVGLILGIIGLIVGVICIPAVYGIVETRIARQAWSARLQATRGVIGASGTDEVPRIAYSDYDQTITVDQHGNTSHQIRTRAVNVSDEQQATVSFVIYGDKPTIAPPDVEPWIEVAGNRMRGQLKSWDNPSSSGIVEYTLAEPLSPGAEITFTCSWKLPAIFKEGNDYFNFDFGPKHFRISIHFHFSEHWKINYVRWKDADVNVYRHPPKVSHNSVHAKLGFPDQRSRHTMLFGLSKQTGQQPHAPEPAAGPVSSGKPTRGPGESRGASTHVVKSCHQRIR